MAKKNYYAVKIGRKTGVFNNWADCAKSVNKYPGAVYQGFTKEEDARAFLSDSSDLEERPISKTSSTKQKPTELAAYAYVDGSYNAETGVYGYGGFLCIGDQKIILQGNGNEPEMATMHNVAGEVLGCKIAVYEARRRGVKSLTIYYDYLGIEKWATGEWERNKVGTKYYHEIMKDAMKHMTIVFKKVKAHTGIDGNEEADKLAKQAVLSDSSDSEERPIRKTPSTKQKPTELPAYAYVDGSYNAETGVYGYGGFLCIGDQKIILQGNGNAPEMATMHNVAGEVLGCRIAVFEARRCGVKSLTIYYDYLGIEKWATGEWERNKVGTKYYHEIMKDAMKHMTIVFKKVKAHTGIDGNEEADKLAKQAVGLL